MRPQDCEKCPLSSTRMVSPGESRLARQASQAAWPEPV